MIVQHLTEYEPVPVGKSLDVLFKYMLEYKDVVEAMVESFAYLSELTKEDEVCIIAPNQ